MKTHLLIDRRDMSVTRVSLAEAASIMDLPADQIEWAIEEYGRCDDGERTAILDRYEP